MLSRRAMAQQRVGRPLRQSMSIPAPIGGWVTAQNLAASKPDTCLIMDNWFPTTTSIRVRGGNSLYATISADEPTESFLSYVGAASDKLFACGDGAIFDISTIFDPSTPPTPDVTGRTANYYAHANFATSGGHFLYAVNGEDSALLYNGAIWQAVSASSSPIAIAGVDTDTFSHVNGYRNRLYFVEGGSMRVWYLPVDSIGGSASPLSLAGIFIKGGSVLFTATWSLDAGDGLDDKLVVVSTQGQAAVFQGASPDADDWTLVGVYDISPPMGMNAWFRAGGDLVIATESGMIPISMAVEKDPAALAMDAVSKAIEPDWRREARRRRQLPWEIAKWDVRSAFYVNTPRIQDYDPLITFVGNLQTGAWCRYTGWDTRTVIVHNNQLYFGCNDGTVRLGEVTGSDNGMIYNSEMAFAWNHLGQPGFTKTLRQAKAQWTTTQPFAFRFSASVSYAQSFPPAPSVIPVTSITALWGVSDWDQAQWDAGAEVYSLTSRWTSIGQTGDVFSFQVQVPNGNTPTPSAELQVVHLTYEIGGLTV